MVDRYDRAEDRDNIARLALTAVMRTSENSEAGLRMMTGDTGLALF